MERNIIEHHYLMNKNGYFFSVEKRLRIDLAFLTCNAVESFPTLDALYERAMKLWNLDRNEVECEIQFKEENGKVVLIDARGEKEIFDGFISEYIVTFLN